MKKTKLFAIIFFSILLVCTVGFASCAEDDIPEDVPNEESDGSLNGDNSAVVSFLVDDNAFATQNWSKPTVPQTAPEKAGYSFGGWYLDNNTWKVPFNNYTLTQLPITENTNAYARWTLTTYKVTYVLDGGTNSAENPDFYTIESDTITLAEPTRDGYTFDGWYNGDERVTKINWGSTGDLTLTARWNTFESITITYLSGGGTGTMAKQTCKVGDYLSLNLFTKADSVFAGWKDQNNNVYRNGQEIPATTNSSSLTLTAQWRGNHGLDISTWQGGMNYNSVLSYSDFWIIRAGFGFSTMDNAFEDHYAAAKRLGIPVGAYWYSYATTYEEGRREAEYAYKNCIKGKTFEFPIFIDVEDASQKSDRAGVTQAIIGFCDYMFEHGVYAGLYTYTSFIDGNYIDIAAIDARYDIWIAAYFGDYSSDHDVPYEGAAMWQYSDKCSISGSEYDANVAYKDYETVIKYFGMNGFSSGGGTFKSYLTLAQEVLDGKWGSGDARKARLISAGYDYDGVQQAVAWLSSN